MATMQTMTHSTSEALKSHLAQVFAQYPIEVAHGDGVWLYARDGRKILDFYGGHAVAGLGYGHPRWLAALERHEIRHLLRKAVGELPPMYREIFLLRDVEELSVAETAEVLQITAVSVKVRLHRARIMLQKNLVPQLKQMNAQSNSKRRWFPWS